MRATALEILADVAIYDGHLAEVAEITDELDRLGVQLDDAHAVAIAAVDAALALTFDGRADFALAHLGALDQGGFCPSDRAWLMYSEGEPSPPSEKSGLRRRSPRPSRWPERSGIRS